jgi:O-antigen/teichoic acid export membrane protein
MGVSTFVTAIAALVAQPVFTILYGAVYAPAVSLVYWLIPFGALFGLGVALGPMWRALNKVKISIGINVVALSIGIPLGMVALAQWGMVGAVAMVTGWYTVSHGVSFTYLVRLLGKR